MPVAIPNERGGHFYHIYFTLLLELYGYSYMHTLIATVLLLLQA